MDHLAIHKVFVSHSSRDRDFVEQEVIPLLTSQGFEVFYSPDSIVPADKWERTLLKGLNECDTFLLVMSPQSAQSPWVKRDVQRQKKSRRRQLEIPVWRTESGSEARMAIFRYRRVAMLQDCQVRKLLSLLSQGISVRLASVKTGMDEKTARNYRKAARMPSELSARHD